MTLARPLVAPCAALTSGADSAIAMTPAGSAASLYIIASPSGRPSASTASTVPEVPSTQSAAMRPGSTPTSAELRAAETAASQTRGSRGLRPVLGHRRLAGGHDLAGGVDDERADPGGSKVDPEGEVSGHSMRAGISRRPNR